MLLQWIYITTSNPTVESLYLLPVIFFFRIFINILGYYYYLLDVWPKGSAIENIGYIIIL